MTFITLASDKDSSERVLKFLPISLVISIYKVITKVLQAYTAPQTSYIYNPETNIWLNSGLYVNPYMYVIAVIMERVPLVLFRPT